MFPCCLTLFQTLVIKDSRQYRHPLMSFLIQCLYCAGIISIFCTLDNQRELSVIKFIVESAPSSSGPVDPANGTPFCEKIMQMVGLVAVAI